MQLYDFGVADDGTFYYVMELLDGLDLETLVRRHGALPVERAIYLLRQVCQSLAEAELYGLVHRDIKPANLFVCRYGGEYDFVKVLDFGIAKVTQGEIGDGRDRIDTRQRRARHPQLHRARAGPRRLARSTARADIYSLGCVAYFLLTGEPVFSGETPLAIAVHHVQTRPAPPSSKSELAIPGALDQLILDCLAKDPADRPQSAKDLARRLAAIGGIEPWTEERARAWWEMNRPEIEA